MEQHDGFAFSFNPVMYLPFRDIHISPFHISLQSSVIYVLQFTTNNYQEGEDSRLPGNFLPLTTYRGLFTFTVTRYY